MKRYILILLVIFCLVKMGFASPIFTVTEHSEGGRVSIVKKLTATITPTSNEPNIGGSSDELYAELLRLSYDVSGSDDVFSIILSDETGKTIFGKTDCNISASYALDEAGTSGTKHAGIPASGALTIDVCDLGKTEIQTLHIISDNNDVNGGTFEILLNDINSKSIAYDCNAAVFEAALEDMNNIDDVAVTGSGIAGPNDPNTFTVTFAGTWYGDDVNLFALDCNSLTTIDPGSTLEGVETETQKGAYNVTGITITVYYRDEKLSIR